MSYLEKFINSYYESSLNSDNNNSENDFKFQRKVDNNKGGIPEYDNYMEPQIDCVAGFCQEACRSLSSINYESSKANNNVAAVLADIYKHGVTAGERIASKYNKAYEEDDYLYNYTAASILNKPGTTPATTSASNSQPSNTNTNTNNTHYGTRKAASSKSSICSFPTSSSSKSATSLPSKPGITNNNNKINKTNRLYDEDATYEKRYQIYFTYIINIVHNTKHISYQYQI